MSISKKKLFILLAVTTFFFGCKQSETTAADSDILETAQQIGDIMASADEQGGSDGTIASLEKYNYKKTFDRFNEEAPGFVATNMASLFVLPAAEATACYVSGTGQGWGACAGRTMVRSFNNCTIGTAVLSGDVTLTWAGGAGSTCSWGGTPTAGTATITRNPNFALTGRRGATLAVTKTGTAGQVLTYQSGTGASTVLHFTNDGVRRKFTTPASLVLFDQTTIVASGTPLVITGDARTNRVMSGGFLTVTDNLSSVVCNFSPLNVTWNTATCNCPVQGSWSGSCSNGNSTTLTLTGCGTGNYTQGDTSTVVTFDRCSND